MAAARRVGAHLAEELAVPVFFYDDADPAGRSLPTVRRDAFADRAPTSARRDRTRGSAPPP